MSYLVLGGIAVACAIGWFFSQISFKTILYYMREKGYAPPTDAEIKTYTAKAIKDTFTFGRKKGR